MSGGRQADVLLVIRQAETAGAYEALTCVVERAKETGVELDAILRINPLLPAFLLTSERTMVINQCEVDIWGWRP